MNRKGFTLIEVLIVIAIVGVLSSIVFANLNAQRARARDSIRKQTLRQLKIALELYKEDFGNYPSSLGLWFSSEPLNTYYHNETSGDVWTHYNNGNYIQGLAPAYISALPRDPSGGLASTFLGINCTQAGWKRAYLYYSNGISYKLLSHCSREGPVTPGDQLVDPQRVGIAWMVCSPDGALCGM